MTKEDLEKENAELKKHIKADCIDCVDYIKNQKLEKQIEKMKCCMNCRHSRTEYEHCKTDKHEKWEMKE